MNIDHSFMEWNLKDPLWIIYVQPQWVFEVPIHEAVIKRMEDSADEHCLSIRPREQILVFLNLRKEDGTHLHDEVDKLRMLG